MLTFSNLALGFLALMMLHMDLARIGVGFIILAMFLDGIDGRMARKLNVSGSWDYCGVFKYLSGSSVVCGCHIYFGDVRIDGNHYTLSLL